MVKNLFVGGSTRRPWRLEHEVRGKDLRRGYDRYVVMEAFTPGVPLGGVAASVWRMTEKSNVERAIKGLAFLKALFAA
jgi:hypothetical protein